MDGIRRTIAQICVCVTLAGPSCQQQESNSSPKPVTRSTVAETVTNFGLVGIWRWDCGAPPSGDNPQATFTAQSDGSATVEYETRVQHSIRPIHDARVDQAGHLHVQYIDRDVPLSDGLRRSHGIDSTVVNSDLVTNVVWAMQSGSELLNVEVSRCFTSVGSVVFLAKDGYLLDQTGKRIGRPTTDHRCSG
jgi:hypothetical protein